MTKQKDCQRSAVFLFWGQDGIKYIEKGVGRRELTLIYIIPRRQKNGNKKAALRPPSCFLNRVTDFRKVMYFDCSSIIADI